MHASASAFPLSLRQFWEAPLVWVALAFTFGVVLDRYCPIDVWASSTIIATFVCLWLITTRRPGSRAGLLFLAAALVGCGTVRHHLSVHSVAADDISCLTDDEPRPVQLVGTVATEPAVNKHDDDPLSSFPGHDSLRFVLRVEAHGSPGRRSPASGLVQVSMSRTDDNDSLFLPEVRAHVGDRVCVLGKISLPSGPANPSDFDYAGMLHDQGIRTVLSVPPHPDAVIVEERAGTMSFFGWLGRLQSWGRAELEKNLSAHQGVAVALLLGDGGGMTAGDWEKYFRTGVIHALAVSGQHLVVLAGFLAFVLRLVRTPMRTRALSITLVLISYAFLTGGRPAAMRAAWMVAAFSGGALLGRIALPANAFALSWLGVVLVQPADIFSSGCLLSFACVLVLLWALSLLTEFAPAPDPLAEVVRKARPMIVALLIDFLKMVGLLYLAGLIVWLAILPFIAQRFHLLPFAGLAIGPPVVFLSELALIGGFLLLLCCALLPPLAAGPAWFTQTCLAGCENLVDLGVRAPGGYCFVPDVPGWWVALFYLALVPALTVPMLRRRWRWTVAGGLLWNLISCWLWFGPISTGEFRCTFLAVGHGGCTVIETAGGRVLIYDAGALTGPDLTRRHIAPFLWQRGYRHIDEIVLSHADTDHFNGLPSLLEYFAVRQVTMTPSFADRNNKPVRLTLRALEERGVPMRKVMAGDRWELDDVSFEVLHPPLVGPPGVENVRSLVLKVKQGRGTLLLTGDLQDEGMKRVLARPAGPIDVLMSPHHGSKTSNTPALADWARPQVVVSCQRRPVGTKRPANVFEERGVPFLGTWPHGAVTIRDSGGNWLVETYRTRQEFAIKNRW